MSESRKQDHLNICLNSDVSTGSTRLSEIHLVHRSLPELDLDEIETQSTFLGSKVSAPLFISSMTGGSQQGANINRALAETAQQVKIPMGLGSIRILFEQEHIIPDFCIKKYAPDIPIFANLGANELARITYKDIFSMLEKLEVSAIALHLNPAQELYQLEGERNFRNFITRIKEFITSSPVPVIVKETGYGIHSDEASILLGYGASYVDIAGGGGSNWAKIEHIRNNTNPILQDVYELAMPTAMILLSMSKNLNTQDNILASGGIRTALDAVKCLVLGAKGVGLALPVLQEVEKGSEHCIAYFEMLIAQMKKIMLLCGAKDIASLSQVRYWIEEKLVQDTESYYNCLRIE